MLIPPRNVQLRIVVVQSLDVPKRPAIRTPVRIAGCRRRDDSCRVGAVCGRDIRRQNTCSRSHHGRGHEGHGRTTRRGPDVHEGAEICIEGGTDLQPIVQKPGHDENVQRYWIEFLLRELLAAWRPGIVREDTSLWP